MISFAETLEQKSYILDVPNVYHVHTYPNIIFLGDECMSSELFTPVSAIGGGFFGRILLGFCVKDGSQANSGSSWIVPRR